MSQSQMIVAILNRGRPMLRGHLGDFTDAEMFARPVPTANHAAWQVTHLLKSSANMARAIVPSLGVVLPPQVESVNREMAVVNDPAMFPTKAELLHGFEAVVAALAEGVAGMSDAQLDAASPEPYTKMAPTFGQLALMVPLHMSMHVGQFQVIRRALGKPVMF